MIFTELFLTFFMIGLFTFGGGYAMIPLIGEQMLEKGWLANEEIIDFIAVAESTPGPFAINIATYAGSEVGGAGFWRILGAFSATLGVVLPSFIVILIIARVYEKFKTSKIVAGVMSGLRPAVIGLIATAVLSIGKTAFFPNGIAASVFCDIKTYISLAIFAIATVLAFKKKHPIVIICLSALAGILTGYILNY